MNYRLAVLSALSFALGVIFLLVATGAAFAATTSWADDHWPPDQYREDKSVMVTFVSTYAGLEAVCGKADAGFHINACYRFDDKTIYLPNPGTKISKYHDYHDEDFARIVSHELGHANGWPADHPRP